MFKDIYWLDGHVQYTTFGWLDTGITIYTYFFGVGTEFWIDRRYKSIGYALRIPTIITYGTMWYFVAYPKMCHLDIRPWNRMIPFSWHWRNPLKKRWPKV